MLLLLLHFLGPFCHMPYDMNMKVAELTCLPGVECNKHSETKLEKQSGKTHEH